METKKPVRAWPLRALAFLLLTLALLHAVSEVLEEKRYRDSVAAFYAEPKNSVEVLLLGASKVHNGVSAPQLERDFGIRTNNFAQNGQVLPETYYFLEEALQYQTPKVVVLDPYKVVQDDKTNGRVALHYSTDFLRLGLPKLRMIFDLIEPAERPEYLFNIIAYHTRWKELTDADYLPPDVSEKGTQTLHGHYQPYAGWEVVPEEITAPPAQIQIDYLDRIVALCRERGIELLLVSVPFTTPEDDDLHRQAVCNGMKDYAAENGLPYLNLMHRTEEMGFDFWTDMSDMYHVNAQGMEKVTAYLGAYLTEHYDVGGKQG